VGKPIHVLGVSCHYHDAAAALVSDGRIVAAAQEERFNREKYSNAFPIQAINACLQEGEISVWDLDAIAFYEKPYLKLARTIVGHVNAWPASFPNFRSMLPSWLEERLSFPVTVQDRLGFDGPVLFVKHHMSHAASAFYASGFDETAILTVDGIGEWASATWGIARGTDIRLEQELRYPNSLGLLYSIVSTYLGFRVFEGEGKVMALAAFGEPAYLDLFRRCVPSCPDGSFRMDPAFFSLNKGTKMYSRAFVDLFGPERAPDAELETRHKDVAASLQARVEEIVLDMARHVQARTGQRRLCAAGGVFLNVLANRRILDETPFEDLFVQPAAGDAGSAIGAASFVSHARFGVPRGPRMESAFLGPSYSRDRIRRLLAREGLAFRLLEGDDLASFVAGRLAEGQIVAWFSGRMECGPRALGHRSILADPRRADMKEILNARVKHREWFRPYGVSVLEEEMGSFFDLARPSPYMLLVGRVKPEKADLIPSAIHVDGTCRLQSVTEAIHSDFYRVIREFFRLTGVPMVLNTSFNVREPIVCTPEDALATFLRTDMDWLVLDGFVVESRRGGERAAAPAFPARRGTDAARLL
jgi:carbamoyltransferase